MDHLHTLRGCCFCSREASHPRDMPQSYIWAHLHTLREFRFHSLISGTSPRATSEPTCTHFEDSASARVCHNWLANLVQDEQRLHLGEVLPPRRLRYSAIRPRRQGRRKLSCWTIKMTRESGRGWKLRVLSKLIVSLVVPVAFLATMYVDHQKRFVSDEFGWPVAGRRPPVVPSDGVKDTY